MFEKINKKKSSLLAEEKNLDDLKEFKSNSYYEKVQDSAKTEKIFEKLEEANKTNSSIPIPVETPINDNKKNNDFIDKFSEGEERDIELVLFCFFLDWCIKNPIKGSACVAVIGTIYFFANKSF